MAEEWPKESKASHTSGKGSRSIETLDLVKHWLNCCLRGTGKKRITRLNGAGIG